MKTQTSAAITGALLALCVMAGSSAFAENQAAEDPMAEAQAFLASPTGLGQAIATAEQAAGGKVAGIEYQAGESDGESANN